MEQPLKYVAKWEYGLVYLSSISLYRTEQSQSRVGQIQ